MKDNEECPPKDWDSEVENLCPKLSLHPLAESYGKHLSCRL